MKRAIALLVILLISFVCNASPAQTIEEFGQIIYSKEQSSFYFVFVRDNLTYAYQIPVKNASDRDRLKSLVGKMIHVNGRVDFVRDHRDSFSGKEVVTLSKATPFDFHLLAFDMKKFLAQEKYITHERTKIPDRSSGVITLSDEASNTFITAGAVAIGVLTGPISLIPLGVFGLTQL